MLCAPTESTKMLTDTPYADAWWIFDDDLSACCSGKAHNQFAALGFLNRRLLWAKPTLSTAGPTSHWLAIEWRCVLWISICLRRSCMGCRMNTIWTESKASRPIKRSVPPRSLWREHQRTSITPSFSHQSLTHMVSKRVEDRSHHWVTDA